MPGNEEQIHTLYWNDRLQEVYAAIRRDQPIEEQHQTLFDGYSDRGTLALYRYPVYGSVSIARIVSSLPTVKIRCVVTPAIQTSDPLKSRPMTLLLSETETPFQQTLLWLNYERLHVSLSCEYRVEKYLDLYGETVTRVALEGSYPGHVQWIYCSRFRQYPEVWSEEEMLPLENLLHAYATNQAHKYWELRKAPEGLTHCRYSAKKRSWSDELEGNTPEELAEQIKRSQGWGER